MHSSPFLAENAPFSRKVLLIGDRSHSAAILESMAREGKGWVNVVARSPAQYAAELLLANGQRIEFVPAGTCPAIAGLLATQMRAGGLFASLATSPGAMSALWRTIQDVRMAGLRAVDLEESLFCAKTRGQDLREILSAYERFLSERGWIDDADALRQGVRFAAGLKDLLLVPEPWRWAGLEKAFLDAANTGVRKFPLYRGNDLRGMEAKLAVFHAVSQEAEAREVVRRILSSGRKFDEIEIAISGPDYDRAVLTELLDNLEIPYTMGSGFPLATSRPGKAFLGYLAWVEKGFEVGGLVELLRSGVLSLRRVDRELSGLAVARALSRYSLYKGLPAYPKVCSAYEAELDEKASEARREGDNDRADRYMGSKQDFAVVRDAIESIVGGAEAWANGTGRVSLSTAVEGCKGFLKRFGGTGSEFDVAVGASLSAALDAIILVGDRQLTIQDTCALLRETALALPLGAERARPGKVRITSLDRTGWEGRALTFVTGLALNNYPGRMFQDPYLLDEERKRLSTALPASDAVLSDRMTTVQGCLASLRGEAVLSTYIYETQEGRGVGAAGVFLHAARKALGKPDLTYRSLQEALGAPVGIAAEGPVVDGLSWWMANNVSRACVEDAFPWATASRMAGEARALPVMGHHDGLVPSAAGALDPTSTGRVISATYMADLASCPFRFFLKRLLRIVPKEDEERDPLVWLNPREKGNVLHEVYAAFLKERIGTKPEVARDMDRLQALLDESLARIKNLIPPATEGLYQAVRDGMRRDVTLFLERTVQEYGNRTPILFEEEFGPIEVEFGGSHFSIRGRVDRVDQVGSNEFEVVDYKTGRWSPAKAEIDLPAAFQPMFYLRAAEMAMKQRDSGAIVRAFSFLYSTSAGLWRRVPVTRDWADQVGAEVPRLLEFLAKGRFPKVTRGKNEMEKEQECARCKFSQACGDVPWDRSVEIEEGGHAGAV